MSQPQYLVPDDTVVVAKHLRDERLRNDGQYATITSLQTESFFRSQADQALDDAIGEVLSQTNQKASITDLNTEIVNRTDADTNLQNQISADVTNLSNNYYSKTTSDIRFKPIAQIENKIQSTDTLAKIECTSKNQIQIYATNGTSNQRIGQIYAPVGQAQVNNLAIQADNRLQLVDQYSTTIYGAKAIDTNPANLNWHGCVVNSLDVPTANVLNTLQITSTNAPTLSISSGHAFGVNPSNPALNLPFISIVNEKDTSDSQLLISPQNPQTDSQATQIRMYKRGSTNNLNLNGVDIEVRGKLGYVNGQTIDQPNQLTTKKYVDDAITSSQGGVQDKIEKTTIIGGVSYTGRASINDFGNVVLDSNGNQSIFYDSLVSLQNSSLELTPNDLTLFGTSNIRITPTQITMYQPEATISMNSGIITGLSTEFISLDDQATSKKYVDDALLKVTQLVDKNSDETATNNYKLYIDNDQINFSRGETSEDIWLKMFGTPQLGSNAVVQQSNRSDWYYESENALDNVLNIYLRHVFDQGEDSFYQKESALRLQAGFDSSAFVRISAVRPQNDPAGTNSSITLIPKITTQTRTNYVVPSLRMGYQAGVVLDTPDGNSILSKSECDALYGSTPSGTYLGKTESSGQNWDAQQFQITNIPNIASFSQPDMSIAVNLQTFSDLGLTRDSDQQTFYDARNRRIYALSPPIDNTDATNKQYVQDLFAGCLSQTIDLQWDGKNKRLTNVALPFFPSDSATKEYVDIFATDVYTKQQSDSRYIKQIIDQNINMAGFKIINLQPSTANGECVVHQQLSDYQVYVQTQLDQKATLSNRLDEFQPPNQALNFQSQRLMHVGTGTQNTDAVNLQQVKNLDNILRNRHISMRFTANGNFFQLTTSPSTSVPNSTGTLSLDPSLSVRGDPQNSFFAQWLPVSVSYTRVSDLRTYLTVNWSGVNLNNYLVRCSLCFNGTQGNPSSSLDYAPYISNVNVGQNSQTSVYLLYQRTATQVDATYAFDVTISPINDGYTTQNQISTNSWEIV